MNDYINNTCRNIKNPSAAYDNSRASALHPVPSHPRDTDLTAPEKSPSYNRPSGSDTDPYDAKCEQLRKVRSSNAKKLKITLICFIITAIILFGMCIFQMVNIHNNITNPNQKIIHTDFNKSNDG